MDKLIHISEVLERPKEPQIITDIRNYIIEKFKDLKFTPEDHKYFLNNTELPSVSVICHKYQKETDWDSVAERKAKFLGVTAESLKKEWKLTNMIATNSGTGVHLFGESMMKFLQGSPEEMSEVIMPQFEDGYLIPHSPKEWAVHDYWKHLLFECKGVFPVLPEIKLYVTGEDIETPYAGTLDILLAYIGNNNKINLCIHDYKTNKDLENSWSRKNKKTLLKPFEDAIDEPKSIYTLQLGHYEYGLSRIFKDEPNINIVDRELVWLKDDATYELVKLNSIQNKLCSIIEKKH